jgi:hypothetical protein
MRWYACLYPKIANDKTGEKELLDVSCLKRASVGTILDDPGNDCTIKN